MTDTTPTTASTEPTSENLYDARGWLLDCGFSDELVFDLTDTQIVRFVDREYDGGWDSFLADSTGRLVDRHLTWDLPSKPADAMAQWAVMIAKADALGLLLTDEDADTTPARSER